MNKWEVSYTVEADTKNDAIGGAVMGIFLSGQEVPGLVEVEAVGDQEWEIDEEAAATHGI
jgi:hypothetical protein